MALPAWYREMEPWAKALTALAAAVVGLMALSTVLGVVFAAIAVAIELGFGTVAAGVAALLALAALAVPVLAAYVVLSDDDDEETAEDPVKQLQRQYVDGEIDESTFEDRLERLVDADEAARVVGPTGDEGSTAEGYPAATGDIPEQPDDHTSRDSAVATQRNDSRSAERN